MKKNILFSFITLLLLSTSTIAQETDNPFDKLAKRLYENEMLSSRFLRNYVLVQTKTFKKKVMSDLDRSLAKFDDNLSYFALHISKDSRKDFIALQKFWNSYRLKITDYSGINYINLIKSTKKLESLSTKFRKNIIEDHESYSDNKHYIKLLNLITENNTKVDHIITYYCFKRKLSTNINNDAFDIDFSDIKKNIKKIFKNKRIDTSIKSMHSDLSNGLNSIESYYNKNDYSPKMLYSGQNYFLHKNYLLFKKIIQKLSN